MSASVARVGDVLGVGSRAAWLIAIAGVGGLAALVALATRQGMLPMALGLAVLALLTLVSVRWPLLPLAAFAVLIPIEQVVVFPGFGTISRFAGILFAVAYGVPRLSRIPRLSRLTFGAMPSAGWAYSGWAIVSLGWAIDAGTAWLHLQTLIQLFLIAVLVADFVVQRPAIVRPIFWVYSLSAAATALIGTQSYIAGNLYQDARAVAIQGQDPAQFAAILLPALVFGLYEVLNGGRRILGSAVALLGTIGVVVSGTRGAWFAAAIVVLFFILPQLRPRRRIAAIAMTLALLLVAYQIPGISSLVADRTGNALSTGGAGRTNIWSVAVTIYGTAPVLGVGYANFPVAYTPDVVRASDVTSWATLQGRGPHDLVVGTLIELGPIGLLLLALFLGPLVLRRGWGPDAATVRAALASLLTAGLFLDILSSPKQVWLVIGLAAGLTSIAWRNGRTALLDGNPATPAADAGLTADPSAYGRRPDVSSVPGRRQ